MQTVAQSFVFLPAQHDSGVHENLACSRALRATHTSRRSRPVVGAFAFYRLSQTSLRRRFNAHFAYTQKPTVDTVGFLRYSYSNAVIYRSAAANSGIIIVSTKIPATIDAMSFLVFLLYINPPLFRERL